MYKYRFLCADSILVQLYLDIMWMDWCLLDRAAALSRL